MLAFLSVVAGLTLPNQHAASRAALPARRDAIAGGSAAVFAWAVGLQSAVAADELTLKSGLKYTIQKEGGKGEKPVVGDLIAVRFKCVVEKSGAVIDDIMSSPEPYYYRVGSGQVLPGVEQAVVNMKTGDVWELTIPPELGFGTKGRNASPGKPRIPGDAILKFTLALDAVPGKDEEILEANGVLD